MSPVRVPQDCKDSFIRRYQGHVSAALVLGGVDVEGAHIYTVYPHGSVDRLPYASMGSGELAAMSVFEAGYKEDLEVGAFEFCPVVVLASSKACRIVGKGSC